MWDKKLAVAYLNTHARLVSHDKCAEYVRRAIEAGGLHLRRHTSAQDYGDSLAAAGFSTQETSFFTAADGVVIQPAMRQGRCFEKSTIACAVRKAWM